MKLLVYVIGSPHKKYWKFGIHNCSNFGTGVSIIFGHVTCPANFKRADYSPHTAYHRIKVHIVIMEIWRMSMKKEKFSYNSILEW